MNCENCGAPMVLVRDRDYFFCEYCGSFHFPEESSNGITVLDESPDNLRCPICQNTLSRASIDGCRALYCKKCRGILTDQPSFTKIVNSRRARASGPPDKPRPLNPEELQRQIRCPYCGEMMETHPYYGPGNIVIDTCRRCHVIWLDHGELGEVTDAPGCDRGRWV
jgi:Zn-finger nucleic acid-binding protein